MNKTKKEYTRKNAQESRNIKIMEMYVEEHKSICDICPIFNVSRQRIQQILKELIGKDALREFAIENSEIRKNNRIKELPYIECKNCGDTFKTPLYKSNFCKTECSKEYFKNRKNDPVLLAERKKKRISGIRNWQRNNRDKISIYNKRNWDSIKERDPGRLKYYADRVRERGIKEFGSEEKYLAHKAEESRERYRKIKEDPEKYAIHKEKTNKRAREYRKKLKESNPEKFEKINNDKNNKNRKSYKTKQELKDKIENSTPTIFFT